MFTFRQFVSSLMTNLGPSLMPYRRQYGALYSMAVFILVLSLGLIGSESTSAQEANPQVAAAAAAARKNFDECFYSSVAGQLKTSRTTDYNMVSETAFAAC